MRVRIYLTGRVAIEIDGEVVTREREFRGKQGRLVFAYLVSERTRPVPREELASVVWPDELPAAWEGALSALTSRLAGLLDSPRLKDEGVAFSRGLGLYQLRLPLDVWIDLEAGVSAVDHAEGALRADQPNKVLGPATVGSSIARRPFLPGVE
jgi:DNA-binding SARP family transcriptional activator